MTALEWIELRAPDAYAEVGVTRFAALVSGAESRLKRSDVLDPDENYTLAVAMLSLHWYEISQRGGSVGAIKSEREGEVSRSYAVNESQQGFDTTQWGSELQALLKRTLFNVHTSLTL